MSGSETVVVTSGCVVIGASDVILGHKVGKPVGNSWGSQHTLTHVGRSRMVSGIANSGKGSANR
jgi:hypothetical protein